MHPSEMQSFFAPPMPFHPEELHKHVTELERAFCQLASDDLNARTAVAKATVAAVVAFMEGSIREQGNVAVDRLPSHRPQWRKTTEQGLWPMWEFLRDTLCPELDKLCPELGPRWVPTPMDEGEVKRLKRLRNDVDHGNVVNLADLRMTELFSHRRAAVAVLASVYKSLGSARPGWW